MVSYKILILLLVYEVVCHPGDHPKKTKAATIQQGSTTPSITTTTSTTTTTQLPPTTITVPTTTFVESTDTADTTTNFTDQSVLECTSDKVLDYLNLGSTFIPDLMNCTEKMSDLGYDYLVALNDFYNYKFDEFHHEYERLTENCNGILCSVADSEDIRSKLLRLRAQMFDMLEMITIKSTMRKTAMRCVYHLMKKFIKAATAAIQCSS